MVKKSKTTKKSTSREPTGAAYHRKMAATHHAKGSLHNAKADLLEAQNPPKKGNTVRPY